MAGKFLPQTFFRPYQDYSYAIVARSQQSTLDFRLGRPIGPHCIDSDNSFHGFMHLLRFFDFDYFPALVITAFLTNPMRQFLFMAVRTL
jgi:hypothetical protein